MSLFWQAVASNALVAAGCAAALLVLGKLWRHPAALHMLWLLVLVKLFTPPMVQMPLGWLHGFVADELAPMQSLAPSGAGVQPLPESGATADNKLPDASSAPRAGGSVSFATESQAALVRAFGRLPWSELLLALWCCGSLLVGAVHARAMLTMRRLFRLAAPAGPDTARMAAEVAQALGLRRVPAIFELPLRISPCVYSFGLRPRLLLPAGLFAALERESRRAVLVHELAHVARRDDLVRWFELAATTVFWWHPATWCAARQLRKLEDACCDARVVELMPQHARRFASALLATVDFLAEGQVRLSGVASYFSQALVVKRRLKMILDGTTSRRIGRPLACGLALSAALVLGISFTALEAEPAGSGANAPEATPAEKQPVLSATPEVGSDLQPNAPAKQPAPALMDVEHSFTEWIRNAHLNLELSKTNRNRAEAAQRQLAAVQKAYEAETVTLDQVLEAQRRWAEARVSYARAVSSLATDPAERRYALALASLVATNDALREARKTWKLVHIGHETGSGEALEEAQAREQFFQFKRQSQQLVAEYLDAQEALEANRAQSGKRSD